MSFQHKPESSAAEVEMAIEKLKKLPSARISAAK
jgi:hypothetical protein